MLKKLLLCMLVLVIPLLPACSVPEQDAYNTDLAWKIAYYQSLFSENATANATSQTGHITIMAWSYDTVGQGSWRYFFTGLQAYNAYYDNSGCINGDNINYRAYLAEGTYTMDVLYMKGTQAGIVDFDIDGVEVGSVDTYASPNDYNEFYRVTSIAIATSGLKTIKVRLDGKNASSGNYCAYISSITFWLTD